VIGAADCEPTLNAESFVFCPPYLVDLERGKAQGSLPLIRALAVRSDGRLLLPAQAAKYDESGEHLAVGPLHWSAPH
jgi:hypothetical protein